MVLRLPLKIPQPTHLSMPSSPCSRHLPRCPRRLRTLIRPSEPARNFCARLNQRWDSCLLRSLVFEPGLGTHTCSTSSSSAGRAALPLPEDHAQPYVRIANGSSASRLTTARRVKSFSDSIAPTLRPSSSNSRNFLNQARLLLQLMESRPHGHGKA